MTRLQQYQRKSEVNITGYDTVFCVSTTASALNQTEVTGRRSSLAIMASANLVHTKGLGLAWREKD